MLPGGECQIVAQSWTDYLRHTSLKLSLQHEKLPFTAKRARLRQRLNHFSVTTIPASRQSSKSFSHMLKQPQNIRFSPGRFVPHSFHEDLIYLILVASQNVHRYSVTVAGVVEAKFTSRQHDEALLLAH